MEDNDKRNSNAPSVSSNVSPNVSPEGVEHSGDRANAPTPENAVKSQGPSQPPASGSSAEPDLFDAHEATLPRFTIDAGDVAPLRGRTRTLLGVPTLVTEDAPQTSAAARTKTERDVADDEPPTATFDRAGPQAVQNVELIDGVGDAQDAQYAHDAHDAHDAIDITVDLSDSVELSDGPYDDPNEVTIVSDADVIALPDTTGQMAPVVVEADPAVTAAAADGGAKPGGVKPGGVKPGDARTTAQAMREQRKQSANPSSLAPREVARAAAQGQSTSGSSGRWGALLVAAIMLLASGVWYLTAGTFRRATLTEVPAETATAAASQPVKEPRATNPNNMVKPAEQAPAVTATTTDTSAAVAADALSSAPQKQNAVEQAPEPKSKPSLTATVRGRRARRSARQAHPRKDSVAPAPPAGDSGLSQTPSRKEVISRLESVRSSVRACAAGRSGVADLDVTVAHTGVVMHVLVGGDFAGTTQGSCIARAVRQARFAPFKQERFRLLYPYAI